MKLDCLFRGHKYGLPMNVRDADMGIVALFMVPIAIITGVPMPKVCDKKCRRCGKVKEFSMERPVW